MAACGVRIGLGKTTHTYVYIYVSQSIYIYLYLYTCMCTYVDDHVKIGDWKWSTGRVLCVLLSVQLYVRCSVQDESAWEDLGCFALAAAPYAG